MGPIKMVVMVPGGLATLLCGCSHFLGVFARRTLGVHTVSSGVPVTLLNRQGLAILPIFQGFKTVTVCLMGFGASASVNYQMVRLGYLVCGLALPIGGLWSNDGWVQSFIFIRK